MSVRGSNGRIDMMEFLVFLSESLTLQYKTVRVHFMGECFILKHKILFKSQDTRENNFYSL